MSRRSHRSPPARHESKTNRLDESVGEKSRQLSPVPPVSKRIWLRRWLLSVLTPVVLLTVVEGLLRLFGYGVAPTFWLKTSDGQHLMTNSRYGWLFQSAAPTQPHPCRLTTPKLRDTLRVVVLGESAAMGTPDPSFGFGRILEFMLQQQIPQKRIEVVNAAMRGVNSHIIRHIAQDCAVLQPDLFIVYMGNNEVIGSYGPSTPSGRFGSYPRAILTIQWLRTTRLGQLFRSIAGSGPAATTLPSEQTMETVRTYRLAVDDPRRAPVFNNYRRNLEAIAQATTQTGAKVFLSTVAVNLKNTPPLGSLHRRELNAADLAKWEDLLAKGVAAELQGRLVEAVSLYQAALKLDDHHAELHYRIARCSYAADQFDQARLHFGVARDYDTLQFRADSRLNQIVRKTAEKFAGKNLLLFDAEDALARCELSDHQIPGDRLFYEHVHFRFDGDYHLARSLYPAVLSAFNLSAATNRPPSRAECAQQLAFTRWDEINTTTAMMEMTAEPPFLDQLDHATRQADLQRRLKRDTANLGQEAIKRCVEEYGAAIQLRPDDWHLHFNFANLLYQMQDYPGAARHMGIVASQHPDLAPLRLAYGLALMGAGKNAEAIAEFQAVLRLDPRSERAHEALARIQK